MTQQEAMNRIMENWVRSKRNLAVVLLTMPPNSMTQHSIEFDINQEEQILKSHGFVYQITIQYIHQEPQTEYIFRKYRIKNMPRVLENHRRKYKLHDCESMGIELMVG